MPISQALNFWSRVQRASIMGAAKTAPGGGICCGAAWKRSTVFVISEFTGLRFFACCPNRMVNSDVQKSFLARKPYTPL